MKLTSLFAPALLTIAACAFAQSTTPSEYSFTVSGSQTWTDTGVDLVAGDSVKLSAEVKSGSDSNCRPTGFVVVAGNWGSIPLPSATPGSLIAKTNESANPTLVGAGTTLTLNAAGHLFLGINLGTAFNCAFVVKTEINHNQPAPASATAAPPTPNAGQSAASQDTTSATHPDLRSQLSSAAQVWLKGQFGGSNPSGNEANPNAVNGNSPGATTTATGTGLKLPNVVLDSALRQQLDSLPRRVHDHAGNLGDMVNFVVVGSQDQMQAALAAADWHVADLDSKEAGLKAALDTYQKKDYLEMPMSHLFLFDRMQDFGYEQAQAFSVVASRHHFRIWKAPFTWNNQTVWVGAATHDIGFEKDVRTGKLTHKIDPNVDAERENLADGLDKSGKTKSMTYYLPPNPVQDAKNASGGSYHSDGRLLVVFLK